MTETQTEDPKQDIEDERKHRVLGASWAEKARLVDSIAAFVAAENKHFATLDQPPYIDGFDPELAAASRLPINARPLHRRIYWANKSLDGYQSEDDAYAEARLERKIGEDSWSQTIKLAGKQGPGKTLSRREYERDVAIFGIDLSLLPVDARRDAESILGSQPLKPVICLEGQGVPLLYHPDGRADVLFEIKFDKGKGFSFDGESAEIVEIEIELKESAPSAKKDDIEALFDLSDELLYRTFPDGLAHSTRSKPAPLFAHLREWRKRDRAAFEAAYDALSDDRWAAPATP